MVSHFVIPRDMKSVSLLLLAASALMAGASLPAPAPAPSPSAVKILGLFDRLRDTSQAHRVAFSLSESEINEYLRYALKTTPRPGVDSVTVKFFSQDYISTFTTVDFDALAKWQPGAIPAALRPVLNGKKSIWLDCRVHTGAAGLAFHVEKARYNDIPLPAFFVEKMIQIVAARQPEKYDTSHPIPLPFGLQKLSTGEHLIEGHN